jgi:DNA-binding response OmpR family regulator
MNPQKNILLVEDEELIRDLYQRELTKNGFLIKAVGSAEDGLTALSQPPAYDMLLLDIMLPGMNGLQMLREFKIKNPNSNMIVILLTNLGQDSVIKEGFEL